MGIIKAVTVQGTNKLVIPYAGKMFRSNISNDNKALCFVINKGYIETSDLNSMLAVLDDVDTNDTIVKVGSIEKVKLKNTNTVVYRQRVFFKSLKVMLSLCKLFGLRFELGSDFHITINNVLNCIDDLKYLERYARRFDEPIDVWLTNCCIIHLHNLLQNMHMYSSLHDRVNKCLKGKQGYLDRTPFLISSYSIDSKSSGIFILLNSSDKRMFSHSVDGMIFEEFGFTEKNVAKDIKEGILR